MAFGPKTDLSAGLSSNLNGDGLLDLAVANYDSYSVTVLPGNGDGTFGPRMDFDTGYPNYRPRSVAIADLNADGRPDLALANSPPVTVLLNTAPPLAVGETSVGLSLLASVPNPSRGLSVSFTLPDAKPARLVVYDVSGREVNRRAVGALGAGRHMVTLGASGTVAPGIYLVHLIRGDRRLVARMVVVR